jgi:protein-tyrosine phosphatase
MRRRDLRSILFLCTGNYYRSRFAEVLFNAVAGRMGLPWRALSQGLALERGIENVGPMSVFAIKALEAMGVRAPVECGRPPMQVTAEDFGRADRVVALKRDEHLPLLQERFLAWAEKVEFWQVEDAPEAVAVIEQEVLGLIARLLGGGNRRDAHAPVPSAQSSDLPRSEPAKKGVTTVFDVPLDEKGLRELAATLKQWCGTGGTVKDGRIEIQGDQRERIVTELEKLGYKVKRAGG